MAFPLKKGCNFYVECIERPSHYAMSSSEQYEEYYGIGFIISGDRKVETPDRTYFVHSGCISPMPMHLYHRTSSLSNVPFKRFGMKFTPLVAARCIEHIGQRTFDELMRHLCYELEPEIQEQVATLFTQMLFEYEHFDNHSEFIMQGILEHIIITIIRYGKVAESAEIKLHITDSTILGILSYLDTHYAENPTVDKLAGIAGLSPSHFMKRFRECVGSSYITYLNHYKIKIAQGMLINTALPIQKISEALGFCNSNYFSSTFRKIVGSSPKVYRRQNRE